MKRDSKALNEQVGGTHYKRYPYHPVEFVMRTRLNYASANIIKYTLRYRDKNGAEDLRKALHYCALGKAMEQYTPRASRKQIEECERFIKRNALSGLVDDIVRAAVLGDYPKAALELFALALVEYGEDISSSITD